MLHKGGVGKRKAVAFFSHLQCDLSPIETDGNLAGFKACWTWAYWRAIKTQYFLQKMILPWSLQTNQAEASKSSPGERRLSAYQPFRIPVYQHHVAAGLFWFCLFLSDQRLPLSSFNYAWNSSRQKIMDRISSIVLKKGCIILCEKKRKHDHCLTVKHKKYKQAWP